MRNLDFISPLTLLTNHLSFRTISSISTPTTTTTTTTTTMDRASRHSWQWPFRGSTHLTSTPSTGTASHQTSTSQSSFGTSTLSGFWARRGTWAFRGHQHNASTTTDLDIIPDYVVNYIRGETPETLASKRQQRRGPRGPQSVRIHRHSRGFQSRTANLFMEGDEDSDGQESLVEHGYEKNVQSIGWSSGWRAGLILNLGVSGMLLILIMVVFIAAIARSSSLVGQSSVYTGSCSGARNLGYGLHIISSIMAVAFIAVGNYIFQALSSPTRTEVNRAHDKKKWLDIGIPSARNLLHISSSRTSCIIILLLGVFVVQVFYNSIVFISHSSASYNLALVSDSFFTGSPFTADSTTNPGDLPLRDLLNVQQNAASYTNLSVTDCIRSFSDTLISPFDILLLSTSSTPSPGSLLLTAPVETTLNGFADSITSSSITVNNNDVSFCMARPAQTTETCSVVINSSLLAATALITLLLTFLVGTITLMMAKFQPLATLGDALNSFLDMPDQTTQGHCLLSKADVRAGHWGNAEAKYYVPRDHYWIMTPSVTRWLTWLLIWLTPFTLAIVALALGITSSPLNAMSDFGIPAPSQTFTFAKKSSPASITLVAALPQLLLVAVYMATNALLTTYFVSYELSIFATARSPRALRLSSGLLRGSQTSSIYLTLPRPISWGLFIYFAAMSFVLSQTVFMISITYSAAPLATTEAPAAISGIGMSGISMLILIAMLMILTGFVVGLGLRRAEPSPTAAEGVTAGNPMTLPGGTCSAVLSARCHAQGQGDVASRPMAWGAVQESEGMTVGHATFSYREVWTLNKGGVYA